MIKATKIILICTALIFSSTDIFSQSKKAQELAERAIAKLFEKFPGSSTEKEITVTVTSLEIEDGRYYMNVKVKWYGGGVFSGYFNMKGTINVDSNGCNCIWNCTYYDTDYIIKGKRSRQELNCV